MPTLADCLRDYLAQLEFNHSPHTAKNYRRILTEMVGGIGPLRDIELIRLSDLTDYVQAVSRERRLQRSTLISYCQVIRTFFSWCWQEGVIPRSPARNLALRRSLGPPARKQGIPPAELKRMIEAARWSSARDLALILFLLDTACRAGGVASLKGANLDLPGFSARLLEKGNKWVTVYYGEQTKEAMQAWLEMRPACSHDYVFTARNAPYRRLDERSASDVVRRMALKARAFAPNGKPYGAHALRHSTAEALVRLGLPPYVVQSKLNHDLLSTTLNSYYPSGGDLVPHLSRLHALAALDEEGDEDKSNVTPLTPKSQTG